MSMIYNSYIQQSKIIAIINTHLSLCSGVKLGETLSRSSINIKSLPSPSYFANSILSPLFADRIVLLLDDILDVCVVDSVAKAFAIGMAVRMVAIESIVGFSQCSFKHMSYESLMCGSIGACT